MIYYKTDKNNPHIELLIQHGSYPSEYVYIFIVMFDRSVQLLSPFCLLCSLSATWWSGTTRSTSPNLSWWRRTPPSSCTGAGTASSTVRTAHGCSTNGTLWTSDTPSPRMKECLDLIQRGRVFIFLIIWGKTSTRGLVCSCD